MSRSHHLDLDTSETVTMRGAGARARHRAAVEEALAAAPPLSPTDRARDAGGEPLPASARRGASTAMGASAACAARTTCGEVNP